MKRTILRGALALAFGILPLAAFAQPYTPIQFFRPYDQRGVNVFEPTKQDTVPFDGLRLKWGVGFAQQFQALSHENTADNNSGGGANQLIEIGTGFNLATANLNLDAQLADGVRLNLITYLSSRHHPEAWVKGGFLQIDKMPFLHSEAIDNLMRFVTLRVGHFEINYGDGHFRRTDNGNGMYNPFVGNYLMDAFTTEIGGELYVRGGGFLGLAGVTNGEIQGSVLRPDDRAPSFYGKVGFDRELSPDLRVRLTGSAYMTRKSLSNSLYGGDRAGSRYYFVLEPTNASVSGNFTSGRINPGFRNEVTSFMVNPFVKFQGLELFGLFEKSTGSAVTEPENREWSQFAVEGVYRFLHREQFYVGGRYNVASGELSGSLAEVSVNRLQVGGGWFVTPQILAKVEYVNQQYNDYPASSILNGGRFNGFMVEGVIAF